VDADTALRIVLMIALTGLATDCFYNIVKSVEIENKKRELPQPQISTQPHHRDGFAYFDQLGDDT
jgi:hypothetical protein